MHRHSQSVQLLLISIIPFFHKDILIVHGYNSLPSTPSAFTVFHNFDQQQHQRRRRRRRRKLVLLSAQQEQEQHEQKGLSRKHSFENEIKSTVFTKIKDASSTKLLLYLFINLCIVTSFYTTTTTTTTTHFTSSVTSTTTTTTTTEKLTLFKPQSAYAATSIPPLDSFDPFELKNDLNSPDTNVQKRAKDAIANIKDVYSRVEEPAAPDNTKTNKHSYKNSDPFDLLGIGVQFTTDTSSYSSSTKKSNNIIVASNPQINTPAYDAGLSAGDVITAVNGVSTKRCTPLDIVNQISEDLDAPTMTLSILSSSSSSSSQEQQQPRDVVVQRDFSNVPNPISYKITEIRQQQKTPISDDTTTNPKPTTTIVGYIQIKSFNSIAPTKLKQALMELKSPPNNANAFVIDIQGNSGGALQSAIQCAGLFLEDKVAVNVVRSSSSSSNGGNKEMTIPYKTPRGKLILPPTTPVVLWIDHKTASAAEIFASALRDNCRASLMGETSFGKGLIQSAVTLNDGRKLVLTVARYVTPNKMDINGRGITPDVNGEETGAVPPSFLMPEFVRSDTSYVRFDELMEGLEKSCCCLPLSK